jgi:hypothetical protein
MLFTSVVRSREAVYSRRVLPVLPVVPVLPVRDAVDPPADDDVPLDEVPLDEPVEPDAMPPVEPDDEPLPPY